MSDRLVQENERQYKVIDQMVSAHSIKHDQYRTRARFLNLSLLGVSVLLSALVFAGNEVLDFFGITANGARFSIGLASISVFFLSLVEFRVDWAGLAARHGEAVRSLANLKMKYRRLYSSAEHDAPARLQELTQEYELTTGQVCPILEKEFNRLKGAHTFKRLLSQQIGKHPKAPPPLLSLKLRLQGIRDALLRSQE